MQREEKQMDMFLENSLIKLTDLKKAISQMIYKIGNICTYKNQQQTIDNVSIFSSLL